MKTLKGQAGAGLILIVILVIIALAFVVGFLLRSLLGSIGASPIIFYPGFTNIAGPPYTTYNIGFALGTYNGSVPIPAQMKIQLQINGNATTQNQTCTTSIVNQSGISSQAPAVYSYGGPTANAFNVYYTSPAGYLVIHNVGAFCNVQFAISRQQYLNGFTGTLTFYQFRNAMPVNIGSQPYSSVAGGSGGISEFVGIPILHNTTITSTGTTTSGTSTIGVSASPPPNAQPFSFPLLLTGISSFFTNLFANLVAYFNTPINLLSVNVAGASAKNTSYPNIQLTGSVNLQIPANMVSTAYVIGSSIVRNTQCASFVYQNSTKSFVYQSPLYNATTPNYVFTFTYTPTQQGIYDFGAACQTSTTTFSGGVWSTWTAPQTIALNQTAIDVLNPSTSTAPPQTTVPIGIGSLQNGVVSAIQGFINGIIAFFKSIGL